MMSYIWLIFRDIFSLKLKNFTTTILKFLAANLFEKKRLMSLYLLHKMIRFRKSQANTSSLLAS